MKKLILIAGISMIAAFAMARDIYLSSATATAESAAMLCGGGRRGLVYSVVVSSPGAQGSGITLYNSSFTATGSRLIGPIDTRTIQDSVFNSAFPKGLIYTKTGTAAVMVNYDCY